MFPCTKSVGMCIETIERVKLCVCQFVARRNRNMTVECENVLQRRQEVENL